MWTRFVVALSIALALLAAGCGGQLISNESEQALGEDVDQSIEQEYRLLAPDDPVAIWAVELVRPLEAASGPFRDPGQIGGYKVEVIADDELVNAFAAPGGYTYISTGLILQASTCAEIAGVMGHELAHVTQRHGVKRVEQAYGAAIFTQLVLGGGLAGGVAQGVHSLLLNTAFSQENESEADTVGLQIAFSAGYNPYGLVDFFEKLLALQGGASPPRFLSSHPATQDRVNAVGAQIQQRYGSQVVRGKTQSYGCVGTGLTLDQVKQRVQSGQLRVR